jgi:hypothetical protein
MPEPSFYCKRTCNPHVHSRAIHRRPLLFEKRSCGPFALQRAACKLRHVAPGADPVSRHHQDGAHHDAQGQRHGACAARHDEALTLDADGVPWSLKLISHARAEIEDARALRDSEVAMSLGGLSCALCR